MINVEKKKRGRRKKCDMIDSSMNNIQISVNENKNETEIETPSTGKK